MLRWGKRMKKAAQDEAAPATSPGPKNWKLMEVVPQKVTCEAFIGQPMTPRTWGYTIWRTGQSPTWNGLTIDLPWWLPIDYTLMFNILIYVHLLMVNRFIDHGVLLVNSWLMFDWGWQWGMNGCWMDGTYDHDEFMGDWWLVASG